ncbi:tRNA (adenosine(37)-N6)-threonylcarbamoyltransferase complex ATPase subunit type 1 TsaE [Litoreibacter albidus]|uniref:tRNA threonylcarbamoyladenosine biosynthesis protein TsaE n=1 Tax=Litoreibacter albidus TaxID=670155 RepID=A0A1H2VT14_9RHOB|nr:tRNA (adenosine(37)-N6)-threonylcarbamoyltransferase complex ATPase subunit type 1 TsaE [Litoreibacter albidus]SDW71387.1 tRNA threonylcarbamoyladenosine biosynthesis protein TsaE [Litoreibacter albidus]
MTLPTPPCSDAVSERSTWSADLASIDATAQLARAFAALAQPGLCVLLNGPVGAGKSFFARSVIQTLMAKNGAIEDVPSPTFTLVQTYDLGVLDVWHADLYRLGNPDELIELGLDQAFEAAMCLIEWPDRLGDMRPDAATCLTLTPHPTDYDRRHVEITGPRDLITRLEQAMETSAT